MIDLKMEINNLNGTYYNPLREAFVRLSDDSGLVHKGYKQLLEKHGLGTLKNVFKYDRGHRLHKPGLKKRERFRVILNKPHGSKVVIYLKRFGYPGIFDIFKQRFTRPRIGTGIHDFLGAKRLAENGVAVARPIAYGRECGWFGETRSFAMIEELPQAEALERLLPEWHNTKCEYALLRDKKELISHMALLVLRLHRSGHYHRDLYLSHVFLSKDIYGLERLNLIDLQRVFRPRFLNRRWKIKDLAQLYYSSRDYFSNTDMMRFIYEYFTCNQLGTHHKKLIRAVHRKANRIERHENHKMRRVTKAAD
jgi:heptose I phosphotransferase